MRVLVIGSGGREHCLAWKISQSPLVDQVYCAPGNGGTASLAQNVSIPADNIPELLHFAREERIGLTVVGPEVPLAKGIVDAFKEKGLCIFGPGAAAAEIESSKVFCRELLQQAGVPQPDFRVFSGRSCAEDWVRENGAPCVIKADGLAAGKGVVVAETEHEALDAIQCIMGDRVFGNAGSRILIEEKLEGQEASFHCFVDGTTVLPLAASQDHKRIFDGDKGKNTGGMGAYSPTPALTPEQEQSVVATIIKPTVAALAAAGRPFSGMLYAGLMVTPKGIFVIEYNCRFGDPETQVVVPRLASDIMVPLLACARGSLKTVKLEWKNCSSVCVVATSGGYPDSYETGKRIGGVNIAQSLPDTLVFHAGTRMLQGELFTAGGRVLSVVGLGSNISKAAGVAYTALKKVSFDGMHYRTDIAHYALKKEGLHEPSV